jgi:hypothetical protein
MRQDDFQGAFGRCLTAAASVESVRAAWRVRALTGVGQMGSRGVLGVSLGKRRKT